MCSTGMHSDAHEPVSFNIGITDMVKPYVLKTVWNSLNDFDPYSKSQGYEKARTCTVILL